MSRALKISALFVRLWMKNTCSATSGFCLPKCPINILSTEVSSVHLFDFWLVGKDFLDIGWQAVVFGFDLPYNITQPDEFSDFHRCGSICIVCLIYPTLPRAAPHYQPLNVFSKLSYRARLSGSDSTS